MAQVEKARLEASQKYNDDLITRMSETIQNDRNDYNSRMGFLQEEFKRGQDMIEEYMKQVVEAHKRIGNLESELRLLAAPKHEPHGDHLGNENHEHHDQGGEQHHEGER